MYTTVFIDTTDNQQIKVGLILDNQEDIIVHPVDRQKAQIVLPMLEKLLKKHNLRISDIKEIKVNEGPGSFTGIRVGISIANTLGFLLKIPINSKPVGELTEPTY